MRVLLLNGSPHAAGCTYTALTTVAEVLESAGIATEIVQLKQARSCTACKACKTTRPGRCVIEDDPVNAVIERLAQADALVIGSPVHYAAASGLCTAACDRIFFAAGASLAGKPGAALVSCRRGGSTAALDQLNKYFSYHNMPIVPSQYWNMVHGNTPEEVRQDLEGLQILRNLGYNLAWLLQNLAAGQAAGVIAPQREAPIKTNYIR